MEAPFKHLILLSIDSLRFDAIGCESERGYLRRYSLDKAPDTPHLDRFAREGVRFSGSRSCAAFTPSSHGTMLTGQIPLRHGVRAFLRNRLDAGARTLFERFGQAGFVPLASIDYAHIFGFNQIDRGAQLLPSKDDAAAIAAFRMHAQAGENVFLFCHVGDVHPPYGETHAPEKPEDNLPFVENYLELAGKLGIPLTPEEQKQARASRDALLALSNRIRLWSIENDRAAGINFPRYLAGVNRYDSLRFARFFGKLEAEGLLDQTLVVITADHGHALIESDFMARTDGVATPRKFDHGECVAEEVLRVPLIFWAKSKELRPTVHDFPVSTADIAPTVLGLFNIPFGAAEMDGISRKALILDRYGTGTEWERAQAASDCYAEAWYHDRKKLSDYLKRCTVANRLLDDGFPTHLHQETVRNGRYKLIETQGGRTALYDTVNDPWERMNLLDYFPYYKKWDFIPDYDQLARALVQRLKKRHESATPGSTPKAGGGQAAVPADAKLSDLEARLKELGYIE